MFDTICDVIVGFAGVLAIGFVILIFIYLGYSFHEYCAAPYIISIDENDYYIEEYREENGYYYATTTHGDECKIPVGIAVVKENK